MKIDLYKLSNSVRTVVYKTDLLAKKAYLQDAESASDIEWAAIFLRRALRRLEDLLRSKRDAKANRNL